MCVPSVSSPRSQNIFTFRTISESVVPISGSQHRTVLLSAPCVSSTCSRSCSTNSFLTSDHCVCVNWCLYEQTIHRFSRSSFLSSLCCVCLFVSSQDFTLRRWCSLTSIHFRFTRLLSVIHELLFLSIVLCLKSVHRPSSAVCTRYKGSVPESVSVSGDLYDGWIIVLANSAHLEILKGIISHSNTHNKSHWIPWERSKRFSVLNYNV